MTDGLFRSDTVFKCGRYEDLPDRVIISRKPLYKFKWSYGVILECNDYFLLVQRRTSIEFQIIVRGN